MKIAIVGLLHHPIAEPFAGGMESHTWWLAKKLIERGHEVTLFASGDSDPELGLVPCIERAFATYPQAQTVSGRQACNMSAYASAIRQICQGQFDIIHNNALHPFLLLSAADLPIPMLTVLHTPIYAELAAAVRYAAARNTQGKLAAVAVSKSLATEWQSLIAADVVYNGIAIENWPFVAETSPGMALWYGRIVPEKAPHLALQAALRAGYAIEFAGPIGDQVYFDSQVAPLLESSQVSYLGHLSHPEIKQALARASVLVNTPLWEEPYGFVYAEALATGTPVAAFDSGAAGEILDSHCGVVVREKTVAVLAEAIAAAAQLSRQDCRQRAEAFCHIDVMIAGYERLYRQLLQRQRRQARQGSRQSASTLSSMQLLAGIAT
ncbi:glycosyltransferase [Leptolyngbya sp. BC1307]|uniref:glycosyltransferase n=1 Tax=Leptolyngbya sp. BC1307 TaxID=2029589 RepID=UPI000EFB7E89|nr:glycosyltransferase [Leptolyngbya sp. BC1307]